MRQKNKPFLYNILPRHLLEKLFQNEFPMNNVKELNPNLNKGAGITITIHLI